MDGNVGGFNYFYIDAASFGLAAAINTNAVVVVIEGTVRYLDITTAVNAESQDLVFYAVSIMNIDIVYIDILSPVKCHTNLIGIGNLYPGYLPETRTPQFYGHTQAVLGS